MEVGRVLFSTRLREAAMPDYRVYPVDKDNHIVAVEQVINCDTDQEAIEKARPLVNGHDVELWDGARQVGRIKTGEAQPPTV
jgi:7-cyano-7-deazaguanine synthase in queuosine biosynthesis